MSTETRRTGRGPRVRPLAAAATLAVVGLALGLTLAAQGLIARRAAAVDLPEPAPLTTVQVAPLRFQDGYVVARRFPGLIEPPQRSRLGFERGGTITEVLVEEGGHVARGDVLARLDTRLLEAERDRLDASTRALEAQAELARRTTRRRDALQQRGFTSSQVLDESALGLAEIEARMAEVEAQKAANAVDIDKAVIRAPYDGIVAARHLDDGSTVAAGAPVVELLEAGAVEFEVGVPADVAADLMAGAPAEVAVGGTRYPARFVSARPELDMATRTRSLTFALEGPDRPAFRETGWLEVDDRVASRVAVLPLSALKKGPRGLWTILTVTAGEPLTVAAEAAELIHADADTAYVAGSFPEGARVVVDGTHRVVPGQRVALGTGAR